jgi:hypothetical protein
VLEGGEPDAVQVETPDDHLGVVVGGRDGGEEGRGGGGQGVGCGKRRLEHRRAIKGRVGACVLMSALERNYPRPRSGAENGSGRGEHLPIMERGHVPLSQLFPTQTLVRQSICYPFTNLLFIRICGRAVGPR